MKILIRIYLNLLIAENFKNFIKDIRNLSIEDFWITGDVRPGREKEQWLNLILRKTNL